MTTMTIPAIVVVAVMMTIVTNGMSRGARVVLAMTMTIAMTIGTVIGPAAVAPETRMRTMTETGVEDAAVVQVATTRTKRMIGVDHAHPALGVIVTMTTMTAPDGRAVTATTIEEAVDPGAVIPPA